MEDNREAGEAVHNFLENVKAEFGFLSGLEFECAVACADCNSQGINAGAGYKFLNLPGVGVRGLFYIYFIFNAGKLP